MTKSKENIIINEFKKMVQNNQSETSLKELIRILNATRFYIIARENNEVDSREDELDLQFVKINKFPDKDFLPFFTDSQLCIMAANKLGVKTRVFNFGFAEFLYLTLPALKTNDSFGGFILNPFKENGDSLLMPKAILLKLYEQIEREEVQSPENSLIPLFQRHIPSELPEISEIFYIPLQSTANNTKDVLLFDCPNFYSEYYRGKLEQLLEELNIDKYDIMHTGQFEEPLLLSILKVLYERDLTVENLS